MRFTKRGFPSNNSVGTAGATPAFLRERFRQSIQSQYLQSCAIFLPIGHAYCGQCPPPVLDPLGAASCSPVTPPKAHSTRGQIFRRQDPHLFHLVPKHQYDFRLCCYHYYCRYQWRSNCTTYEEESKDWTQEDAAKSLQDYLIFIEMSLAAVFSVSQSGRSAFNRAREPENDATIQLCTDNNRRQSQY